MVQSAFETYREYTDSVFYDASAWSLANFYNLNYSALTALNSMGEKVESTKNLLTPREFRKADYAYIIHCEDYNSMPLLQDLLDEEIVVLSAFKSFSLATDYGSLSYGYGTLVVPVSKQ